MFDKITKRIVSFMAAAVMTASNVMPMAPIIAEDDEPDLTYQSMELFPNGEGAEQVVTLDGMMPEGAEAEAVDVSADHEGIAAYDITIMDGRKEYQPGDENPIKVEIVDPVITEFIELWHIHDNGEREQLFDFTAEDGKVSFFATGFSVYEIVEPIQEVNEPYNVVSVSGESTHGVYEVKPVSAENSFVYAVDRKIFPGVANKLTSLADLKAHAGDGIYIKSNKHNRYAKAGEAKVDNAGRKGITVTSEKKNSNETENITSGREEGAVKYYFAAVDPGDSDNNLYYIYTYTDENDPSTIQYVVQNGTNSLNFVNSLDDNQTAEWEFSYSGETVSIKAVRDNLSYYWTSKDDKGLAAYQHESATDGEWFTFWIYEPLTKEITSDPYGLSGDNKEYGLVQYANATDGYALLAGASSATQLGSVKMARTVNSETGVVSYSSNESGSSGFFSISGWSFEWVEGTTSYKISARDIDGNVKKYLKLGSGSLTLVEEAEEASALTVVPNGNNGRIKLTADGMGIKRNGSNFQQDTAANAVAFDLVDMSSASADEFRLNGQSYGIAYANGAKGYALTSTAADEPPTKLSKQDIAVAKDSSGNREYINFGDIDNWTFEIVDSNRYLISTQVDGATKYLKVVNGSVFLSETPYILTVVEGIGGNAGKIAIINTVDKSALRYNSNYESNTIDFSKAINFDLVLPTAPAPTADPLGLNGETYGVVVNKGDDAGCAMNPVVSSSKLTGTPMSYENGQYVTHSALLSGWTFHWVEGNQYTLSSPSDQYIQLSGNSIQLTNDSSAATPLAVVTDGGKLVFYNPSTFKVIALNGSAFQGTDSNTTWPVRFDLVEIPETVLDIYGLNGKTTGLMFYNGGNATTGYGMIAEKKDDTKLQIHKLMIRNNTVDLGGKLYVDKDADITMWTFIAVREDQYKLKADNGQYLQLTNDGLTIVSSESDASTFKVVRGTGADSQRIKLQCGANYVQYASNSFQKATSASWLYFVEKSDLTEEDFVVYSATKVGVSDKTPVIDGTGQPVIDPETNEPKMQYVVGNDSQIIVYTRVWNKAEKKYDFYAIDQLGRLVPCYEYGDSIMWVGNQINSLVWDFTEYQYDDGTPNGYYELYNPYSRKYLVPMTGGKVLSNTPVGINLRGRRDNAYYTRIVSWYEPDYTYYALDADAESGTLLCPKDTDLAQKDESADFYFAIVNPKQNTSDAGKLHQVETIDNAQYGITMRMVDWKQVNIANNAGKTQSEFLGTTVGGAVSSTVDNLLSTNLGSDGYPVATANGQSLKALFDNADGTYEATEVNHLFIKSTYEESGYFEFDSCQNTATLIKYLKDADGNIVYDANGMPTICMDPETGKPAIDSSFTVFQELSTDEASLGPTHKHGQFFPYDYILPGIISSPGNNPENLYDARGIELSEDNPRKKEPLYLLQYANTTGKKPNCYNGTELSAGFVQTPNGHDAWDHDIVFEFTGDDDFWFYVDGELVIDLGGIHSALAGNVNFATGEVVVNNKKTTLKEVFFNNYVKRKDPEGTALAQMQETHGDDLTLAAIKADQALKAEYEGLLQSLQATAEAEAQTHVDGIFEPKTVDGTTYYVFKDYTSHTMRIFYMERGAGASNLHMRFNLSYVTPGSVLMNKSVEGVSNVDYSLIKYPYQIYYKEPGDTEFTRLKPNQNYGVYYLNPKREADYYAQYKSLSNNQVYPDVFFLTPGRDVAISFPDNTQSYYIVECGLNGEVYEAVECNGQDFAGDSNSGGKDFQIVEATVKERPDIELVNKVNPNAVKTLTLRKKLVGQGGTEIQDDNTTFSFRLWLEENVASEENGVYTESKKLVLAYLHKYYVVSPGGKFCVWDKGQERFVATDVDYNPDLEDKTPYTFQTSPNGQISRIPVGYEVKVPDLLNGMKFQVEERESDNPIGYDVYSLEGYTCLEDDHTHRPSYKVVSGDSINVGTVIAESSPSMLITNKRGFGIEVKKVWSDADYTTSHDPIYIAVFVDGVLKENTVREITNAKTSQRYFFDDDALYNGTKTLNDYHVYEVTKHIDADDNVTYKRIEPENGVERVAVKAIPKGGSETKFNYTIDYSEGEITGVADNARRDTITNIREGGVAIRLFDWDDKNHPLADGKFRLTLTENGETVDVGKGTYTTDGNGVAAVLYSVSTTGTYTLEEISAPTGYIGMPQSITFTVSDIVTIQDDNNAEGWVDHDTADSSGTYKGIIDIYNKQFTLKANKIDSTTNAGLPGATFALYRGAINGKGKIIQDYYPLSYYKCSNPDCGQIPDHPFNLPEECAHCQGKDFVEETTFVSDANGTIPLITQNLPPDVYFLVEKRPPEHYTGLPVGVIFKIDELGNITIGEAVTVKQDGEDCYFTPKPDFVADYRVQEDYLTHSGNNFTINIPNVNGAHDYYFNIEKYAFLDQNVHHDSADAEQKFVFKVERFGEDDTECNSVLETLYVTIQCDTEKSSYPDNNMLSEFTDHSYDSGTKKITVACADGENYEFPAAIFYGSQCVKLSTTGIYRVTEVSGWSATDYDFWTGSNVYLGNGTVLAQGTSATNLTGQPYVTFRITQADTEQENCASVSFTNTETEYAYLSSQAYAENTINRRGN